MPSFTRTNPCPSLSRNGCRCQLQDGHEGPHLSAWLGNAAEQWTDETAKKRIVLIVTTTEEYEIDIEKLGLIFNPDSPDDLAELYRTDGGAAAEMFENWMVEFFERHELSTYGDEMMPNVEFDREFKLEERTWYD